MGLSKNDKLVYLLLLLGFVAGIIVIFYTQMSYGGGDSTQHYNLARWGWKHPNLLFNHWGKPVFTILSSPFAQFGITGARIYNLMMGILTAIIVWKIAKFFKIKNSALSIIFVLFTPVYFALMFVPLTEVTYSFFVVLSILLFFNKKYWLSAIVFSFTPLIRTEGIVLLPVFILAYSLKRKLTAIPMLLVGFIIVSLLGYTYYDDIWWLITKMPYTGDAASSYGSGSLFRFLNDTRGILGYPLGSFSLIGFVALIIKWIKDDKFQLTDTYYFLLLITGSYIVFLAAHSVAWWQGIGNSLGLIRVIGSVTPLAAITALYGFNCFIGYIKNKNKIVGKVLATALLVWIIILGIVTHIKGFRLSKEQLLAQQAVDFVVNNNLDSNKIYFFDPYVVYALGIDPYNGKISSWGLSDNKIPSSGLPKNSIIIWDSHFGTNEGKVPLSALKNDDKLTLLKVITPKKHFKALGGYDYAIYVFQKK